MKTILVVEDTPSILEFYSIFLTALGFTVIPAVNGLDGLDQWRAHSETIDLVVTDLNMPLMDGNDMIVAMRSEDIKVKIIMVTGNIFDARSRANGGADQVILKPILNLQQFTQCIMHADAATRQLAA